MTARRKKQKFRLVYMGEKIDFRRGYKRCIEPGIETYVPPPVAGLGLRSTRVSAGFWRNRTGGLFVRFNCTYGWVFCYEALLLNGKPVPDKDLNEFIEFILEVLIDWGGSDMDPDENFYIAETECPKTGSRKTGR